MGGAVMRRTIFGVAATLLMLSLLMMSTAHAAPPIEVYGKDPDLSDVQISPDGGKIAMSRTEDGEPVILIVDLATKKAAKFSIGKIKVRSIEWSGDHHVLVYVSETTNQILFRSSLIEFCGVFSLDTRGKSEPKQLLGNSNKLALQSSLCDVESRLWTDTGDVLMSARKDVGRAITGEETLYRVNGVTGRGQSIAKGADSTRYWVTSPKGYIIARVDHQQKANRYRVMVPKDEERLSDWQAVFQEETEIPNLNVYGANADETALIIGTRMKTDLFALFEMSLTDGKIGKPLFEPDGVDVAGVIGDPYSGAIVGASYRKVRSEQIFFQNDLQGVLVAAQKALADWQTVRVTSWDKARQKFVIFAQGNRSAGDYFILDRANGKLDYISSARSEIPKADIASVQPFVYKARDGLSILAYLTVPAGVAPKNLPLVVLPHGGPASRDVQTFDYWAQAIASRGYAVLQMNFRGSSGFGTAFEEAGEREWGGKMQDDVTDGVRHVIAEGIADAAKICIVGGSYGGYSTLAGAAFTPELYKCAMSFAGVSNLGRFKSWVANRYGVDSSSYEYWTKAIGDQAEDADKITARSPTNAAAKVTADVLLIHGKDDTVVPFEQSEFMHDALKDAGKSVQLIKLDGEDHWLSTEKTRTDMLKALEAFLAKHLG
jgi:dipeptidyl aminopeptidase/acylaminoacyl peptidase